MKEEQFDEYKPVEKFELKDIQEEPSKIFKMICCPSCSKDVKSDNLNLENKLGKCNSCHAIFSIAEEVKAVQVEKNVKQETLRPEGIDLFYYEDDLDITVQQHIQGFDALGLFTFPFFAVLTIFIYLVGSKEIPILFPIISTLGSIYFIYRAFNYSKNKTYIDINSKFLSIKSRPKHFKKDKTFNNADIDQLYLKNVDGMHYYVYMSVNALEGQKHVKLLTVNSLSKAKYLEQEIEKYLNIEDRKVPEATA